MTDLGARLHSIENTIRKIKKVIETNSSSRDRRKRKSQSPPTWLRTLTALVFEISTEVRTVKEELQQLCNTGGNTTLARAVDIQQSSVVYQTQVVSTIPAREQPSDGGVTTPSDIRLNQSSETSTVEAEATDLDSGDQECSGRPSRARPDAISRPARPTTANRKGADRVTTNAESDEVANCVLLTKSPIRDSCPAFKLSVRQMGTSLVENVMQFTKQKDFRGIITVEDLPAFDWPSFQTSIQQPKGHDLCGVEYFDVGVADAVGLRVSRRRSFKLPDFTCSPPKPSVADCEDFVRHLIQNPFKDEIQYYVGPSLAQGPPGSSFDGLLHPGLQLSHFARLPGGNEAYWHLGSKFSGTAFHMEDARWGSVNLNARGWKLWIRIWTSHSAKFEAFVRTTWRCNDCDQFVRHQNLLIGLETLRNEGIGFHLDVVGPRQMVVTEPKQYHAVVNMTDSFAISINILSPGEAVFPEPLFVCLECGLYPLEREEFERVASTTTDSASTEPRGTNMVVRKRPRPAHAFEQVQEAKRVTTNQAAVGDDLRVVMTGMRKTDKLCRFPPLNCEATPEVFSLAAAIMSPAAAGQFQRLVTSMREMGTDLVRLGVVEDPIERLVQHIRKIAISGRRSMLERFIVRVSEIHLAEEVDNRDGDGYRLRAKSSLVQSALSKTGWTKTTFDYHLKRGRQWRRICGVYQGLLCFLFLERGNQFDISLDQYRALKDCDLEMFHRLLENDYITTICAAGKAFQETLQSTTPDVEFSWEGKNVSLEKDPEADLLRHIKRFPTLDDNLYIEAKYPDWPRPDGWPEDWGWPRDPTWVHPEHIQCDLCGETKICDCINNFPPRPMPRITFYDGKGRGLRAVACSVGSRAYKRGEIIDMVVGELVPLNRKLKDGWSLVLKRTILDDEHEVCQIYCANKGNLARLVSSVCKPSAATAVVQFQQVSGKIRAILSARREILDGEEITAYYGRDFMRKVLIIASSLLLDNYPPGAHMFDPEGVFKVLYRDFLQPLGGFRVIAFPESSDIILRTGIVGLVEQRLLQYFRQFSSVRGKSSAEIHTENNKRFSDRWRTIQSDTTCFACLRRTPRYQLQCGHSVCHTCVKNFADLNPDDPWILEIRECFLCKTFFSEVVIIKDHPPTAGAGVLCVDGGGIRGIVPLMMLKRIEERIGLPIPFQTFIKVAFGVSSGGLILLDTFLNGQSIDASIEKFGELAKIAFQPRRILDISLISRLAKIPIFSRLLQEPSFPVSWRPLCPVFRRSQNIEAALIEAFGLKRGILDHSYASSTGTMVGLPVATVQPKPSCHIFTNYNGVGAHEQNRVVEPRDGFRNVPIWEVARSVSAAPGFFPPKEIHEVGTFQDDGPLENNPIISALSEVSSMYPLAEEPDFVVSLDTGEAKTGKVPTSPIPRTWKNKALPRLCRLLWEKMRDKKVRQAFKFNPRYHRLDVELDQTEPMLDDTMAIAELKPKVEADGSLSPAVDSVVRCMVASLFYFELEAMPESRSGQSIAIGYIQCSLRNTSLAFPLLLEKLIASSAAFYLDDWRIPGTIGDGSLLVADGNFRKRVELTGRDRFTVALKQGKSEPCNISGSPYSIERLVLAQGLNAYFGTANHRKRKQESIGPRPGRKKQKTL